MHESRPEFPFDLPISVQFRGNVPLVPRHERKVWLTEHFLEMKKDLEDLPVRITDDTLSVSGQSVEAYCDPRSLADIRRRLEAQGHAVNVVRMVKATALPSTGGAPT